MNQAIRGVDLATGRPLDRDQRLYNVGHGVLGIAVTFGPQLLRPTPTGPPKTEIVQRWMSRGELEAIGNTGLLRGGRPGRNYVTNNANSSLLRARQRLALDHTPEVLVTVEVPKNIFPQPTRVAPQYGMPGGGMERMTTQPVPVLRIISISAGKKQ